MCLPPTPTRCSWRCPIEAAAHIAPELLARGKRVFDLSGAFRLRDGAARRRWYPHTQEPTSSVAYGLTERYRQAIATRRWWPVPVAIRPRRFWRCSRCVQAGLIESADHHRRQVGRLGRGQNADRADAFQRVPRQHLRLRGVRAPPCGRDRTGAGHQRDVRAAPRADRSRHFRDHLCACSGRTCRRPTSRWHTRPPTPARRSSASPGKELPEVKHVAHTNFCDIGWRVDHAARQLVLVVCLDNLVKGAAGTGRAEFQRRLRLRRKARAQLTTVLKLGGELLEDADAVRAGRGGHCIARSRADRSSSCTAAGVRSTPTCGHAARHRALSTDCA